jgi:hypothetical protein
VFSCNHKRYVSRADDVSAAIGGKQLRDQLRGWRFVTTTALCARRDIALTVGRSPNCGAGMRNALPSWEVACTIDGRSIHVELTEGVWPITSLVSNASCRLVIRRHRLQITTNSSAEWLSSGATAGPGLLVVNSVNSPVTLSADCLKRSANT